jgi:putative FmdB family regulatory protein
LAVYLFSLDLSYDAGLSRAHRVRKEMPFYEYQCSSCDHHLEVLQKISETPLRKCPHCGKQALKRLISAPVFRLKGGGWYETDFKSDNEQKRNIAGREESETKAEDKSESKVDESKSDAKGDSKGESTKETAKPDSKPAEKPAPASSSAKKSTARSSKPVVKAGKAKVAGKSVKKKAGRR